MSKCDGCESGKNNIDDIWLNPKCRSNGQSAGKSRIEKTPTTMCLQAIGKTAEGTLMGNDIVYALMKVKGFFGINRSSEPI